MSDKMMTPEDYLRENPTHMIKRLKDASVTDIFSVNPEAAFTSLGRANISWTGYTEPHVMIGPDFPQSRKREIEWGDWCICPPDYVLADPEGQPFEGLLLPDGSYVYRYGDYIDEPVKPEPELSRFLPDGWAWVENKKYGKWFVTDGNTCTIGFSDTDEHWESKGLIPPSEGGGFQKHTPFDPMPCDDVDLMWSDGIINRIQEPCSPGGHCIGWRPHYKEQN
jgi:hypothetical protein